MQPNLPVQPNLPAASGLLMSPPPAFFPSLALDDERAVLQRLQSIPIFATLGFFDARFGDGCFACSVPRKPEYDGIFESFHGGLLMTIADSAAAMVALTIWGANSRITTTDMNIRFLAPARSDVRVFAQAIKRGRTLVPVTANLWDERDVLVAVGQVTYMRL